MSVRCSSSAYGREEEEEGSLEWQLDKREAHSFPLWCVAEAHMRRCCGPDPFVRKNIIIRADKKKVFSLAIQFLQ